MFNLFSYDHPIMQFLTKVTNIFYLNILWLICCIPIITIGASTTAMYYVALKIVKNQEGSISTAFFSSFKENFKQATILWLIVAVLGIILTIDGLFFYRMQDKGLLWTIGTALFFAIAAVYIMIALYVFPLQSRFENTVKATIQNAVILGIRFLPRTILMLLIHIILGYITFFLIPPLILCWMGLVSVLCSFLLSKIFAICEKR